MKCGWLMWGAVGAAIAPVLPAAAAAQGAPLTAVAPALAVAPDVAAAYDTYRFAPLWLRDADNMAVAQLMAILQRAPFDGFAEGPQLATQVEALAAQARANPALGASAERMISSA